jgi:hypothetical protein
MNKNGEKRSEGNLLNSSLKNPPKDTLPGYSLAIKIAFVIYCECYLLFNYLSTQETCSNGPIDQNGASNRRRNRMLANQTKL